MQRSGIQLSGSKKREVIQCEEFAGSPGWGLWGLSVKTVLASPVPDVSEVILSTFTCFHFSYGCFHCYLWLAVFCTSSYYRQFLKSKISRKMLDFQLLFNGWVFVLVASHLAVAQFVLVCSYHQN